MFHNRRLVDAKTGDQFDQPAPHGRVYPVSCADGDAPSTQRGRTFEDLTASGRDLQPES